MPSTEILEIDPDKVRVFVHRERDEENHRAAIEDTRKRGQIEPGEVRDIRHWDRKDRLTAEGKVADWGLIVGEGRLLRAKALGRKFRAIVREGSDLDVVGRFLSENMNRMDMPWSERANLAQPLFQAGKSAADVADLLSISLKSAERMRRILAKTAPGLEDEVAAMSINKAEVFTALPAEHQTIVMEAFHDTKESDIAALVKVARRVTTKDGKLTADDLKKKLARIDSDLRDLRDALKVKRLHHSLGPSNLAQLLEDKKFSAAITKAGVNIARFEQVTSEP